MIVQPLPLANSMTNPPPREPQSSRRAALGFDELIGILIAFSTIGIILFWAIAQKAQFKLTNLIPPTTKVSTQPITPTPAPRAASAVVSPVAIAPTASPDSYSVTPSPTTQIQSVPIPVIVPNPSTIPAKLAPTTKPLAKPVGFVDVPENFWARPYIETLQAQGIMTGFPGGDFRPNQPVTRAEFAGIVQKAFAKKPIRGIKAFKDLPSKHWATPEIDGAYRSGFLNGYPKNVFQPELHISRSQALVSLVTGLDLPAESNPTQEAQVLQIYSDAEQIPNYAKDKITAATKAGLVVNYPQPKLLRPNQDANRAEISALIYQALVKAGKAKPIQSQYIIQPPS